MDRGYRLNSDTDHYLLQFFKWEHLPPKLQKISAPFGELAKDLAENLPHNAELSMSLRKLLEAKDCAVRAFLFDYNDKADGG